MEQSLDVRSLASAVLHAEKTVSYQYEEPVREVVTRLRLFPLAKHGSQHLLRHELEVWPEPTHSRNYKDHFGNEVREFTHAVIEKRLHFALRLWTEHRPASRSAVGKRVSDPGELSDAGASTFLALTRLVDASTEIQEMALQFRAQTPDPRLRADRISRWVYQTMRFQSGVTAIDTPASVALSGRTGVCQDYAHLMLALCRLSGIPARYVSGFIPSEGYMHAWVETLVGDPDGRSARWTGFDPTHNRPTDHHYLTVATGRDYTDISPISGSFYGSVPGRLQTWSRTVAQTTLPEVRTGSWRVGATTAAVTDRIPDGNIPAIQPGYSC